MSIEVVNGYVCHSCCDVTLAKKGVDPAHPNDDPANPQYDPKVAAQDKAKASGNYAPAVTFGGQLAAANAVTPAATTQSAPAYSPGSLVNVSA